MNRPAGPVANVRAPARPRLGRAERRAAIIDAAAHAFAVTGFTGTSMADITAVAGVSHLIVYRHFDSKEALYSAVLDRALEQLAAALDAPNAIDTYGPTPRAVLASARADPHAFSVLWNHAAREPEFAAQAKRAQRRLGRATRAALTPLVSPQSLTWATRATLIYVVQAVLVWIEDGDPRYDDRFVRATRAAMRAGVRSWVEP